MKQPILYILSFFFISSILSACKPDLPDFPPDATMDGTSYQPVTAGSTWVYKDEDPTFGTDTVTMTMTGKTSAYLGKTYYEMKNQHNSSATDTSYYYRNHSYTVRSLEFSPNAAIEFLYLKDNVAAGTTWTNSFTDSSLGVTISSDLTGKVVERGITKTVLGKTYTDVIHTSVVVKLTIGGLGTSDTSTSDFYVAKNIGIIEVDNNDGTTTSTTKLMSYTIK